MNMIGRISAPMLIVMVMMFPLTAGAANPSEQKPAAVSAPFDGAFFSTALAIFPFELMPGLLMGFEQDGRFVTSYAFLPECTEGAYTILSTGKIKATASKQYSETYELETIFTLTKPNFQASKCKPFDIAS